MISAIKKLFGPDKYRHRRNLETATTGAGMADMVARQLGYASLTELEQLANDEEESNRLPAEASAMREKEEAEKRLAEAQAELEASAQREAEYRDVAISNEPAIRRVEELKDLAARSPNLISAMEARLAELLADAGSSGPQERDLALDYQITSLLKQRAILAAIPAAIQLLESRIAASAKRLQEIEAAS